MSLAIQDGHAVAIHYSLTLDDGTLAEDSGGGAPLVYVQGEREVPPGLERGLEGLRVGDERELVLAPAEGFGVADLTLERAVDASLFPVGVELEPGMSFGAESSQGVTQMWIKEIRGEEVVVTPNHPLAGRTLTYRVRVMDVQEAAAESAESPST